MEKKVITPGLCTPSILYWFKIIGCWFKMVAHWSNMVIHSAFLSSDVSDMTFFFVFLEADPSQFPF